MSIRSILTCAVLSLLMVLLFGSPAAAVRDENLGTSIKDLRPKDPPDPKMIRVIGEVAKFYERMNMANEARKVRQQVADGVFIFASSDEMGSDQGRFRNGKILINQGNADNLIDLLSKNAKVGPNRLISLAATIFHENLHAEQGDGTFVVGTLESAATGNNTRIEQEVWRKTQAVLAQWIDVLVKQRGAARTDAERSEIQRWLDAAIQEWVSNTAEIINKLANADQAGDVADTQWAGPGGISGTLSGGKQSELWKKYQAWKAGLNSPDSGTRGSVPPVSGQEMLDAICRCSTACTATSYHGTTPVEASPSCADPSNGPCVCSGYGCMRSVMSPACIVQALQENKGEALKLADVIRFIDQNQVKPSAVQDPASIPPLVRKGEALRMSIVVPGKEPEKWLWRSDDGKTFQATRLTPGTGPATETVRLKAPSMGYLEFERGSNDSKILSIREPMNGGFQGGIADGLPAGATISAYMIQDPGPAGAATSGTVSAPASPPPDFGRPTQMVTIGQWGIFEPVQRPMTLHGKTYSRFFLQHPGAGGPTEIHYALKGGTKRLTAWVGIDQSLHPEVPIGRGATVRITATADGRTLWNSGLIALQTPPVKVDLNLSGVQELVLIVEDGADGLDFDWLVWADPVLSAGDGALAPD